MHLRVLNKVGSRLVVTVVLVGRPGVRIGGDRANVIDRRLDGAPSEVLVAREEVHGRLAAPSLRHPAEARRGRDGEVVRERQQQQVDQRVVVVLAALDAVVARVELVATVGIRGAEDELDSRMALVVLYGALTDARHVGREEDGNLARWRGIQSSEVATYVTESRQLLESHQQAESKELINVDPVAAGRLALLESERPLELGPADLEADHDRTIRESLVVERPHLVTQLLARNEQLA